MIRWYISKIYEDERWFCNRVCEFEYRNAKHSRSHTLNEHTIDMIVSKVFLLRMNHFK